MEDFKKPPKTFQEQVSLLEERGLIIKDKTAAEEFLSCVNYYRFSAYCLPFEISRHKFKENITFGAIQNIYNLDTSLRCILGKSLEIVENAFRTKFAYYFSHRYGAFFHEDYRNFFVNQSTTFNHSDWIDKVHEEIGRSKETFVEHYKNKYNGFPKMPLWMAVEMMSFGSLSLMYDNLFKKDKIDFAQDVGGFRSEILSSWLHTFSYVRNMCAHHSRLWNRELAIGMLLPKSSNWSSINNKRIGAVIFAIHYFLKNLPLDCDLVRNWHDEMEAILNSFLKIGFFRELGVSENFNEHVLWK